jgi:hypothetical protein
MSEKDDIRDAVLRAVDRVRELLLDENAFPRDESAIVLGEGTGLDSMGYMNFVVAVEDEMSRVSDQPLMLVERFNSSEWVAGDTLTVGQLIAYLRTLTRA